MKAILNVNMNVRVCGLFHRIARLNQERKLNQKTVNFAAELSFY